MARPSRSEKEVEQVKSSILDQALEILVAEGFDRFSMAKVAKQMGMTTANLYNYYKNKDELYNFMVMRGFTLLSEELTAAVNAQQTSLDRVMAAFNSYVHFGLNNTQYYHLMFTMISPKFLDYVGTGTEQVAQIEKQNSLRVIEFVVDVLEQYMADNPGFNGVDSKLITLQFWGQLHGIISLHNSGNLREADDNPMLIIDGVLNNLKLILEKGLV